MRAGFMKTNCIEDVTQIDASKFDGPWSFKNESIFIDLMEEEVAKGNRPTTTFTKTSWTYIKEQLYVRTGYAYTHEQLKNKYNSLRHRYKEFKRLLGDINGKGWDPVLGTITLEEEQWTNLIKVNKKVKKFKKSGCPHYDKLMRIYGDTVAAEFHALPSSKLSSDSEYDNKTESDSPMFNEGYGNNRDENHGQSSMSKKSKRKREVINDIMSSFKEAYIENLKRRNDLLEGRPLGFSSVDVNETSSIARDYGDEDLNKCFKILNSMVDIDDKAYTKILKQLVADTTWRKAFLCIPESRRKGFINNF
ncbi:L10-interacting MYB domain-containing protein-like isoform X2 [Benincasa hispida]|uniref:L10-interacting MYB domain-containing protein-like isoform X2 n=1 Tax=Benincasa hispida TaxID=102211 RepID=UPI0019019B7F|nr:L10-interacting MYB domain-containing protein-like isoform X2 [Benincasa hispida]